MKIIPIRHICRTCGIETIFFIEGLNGVILPENEEFATCRNGHIVISGKGLEKGENDDKIKGLS